MNLEHKTGEPIVGSLVFSFAALLDGQVATIPSILQTGVTTAVNNFIQGEIQWIAGYLPPLPPLPFAATAPSTSAVPAAAAGAVAAPAARPPRGERRKGERRTRPPERRHQPRTAAHHAHPVVEG